uniref:Uncharacterized protein n=1 Tax=Anguilla anguilla TaxID=7936 RepID=A0A0E9TCN5_ANGAN
MHTQVCPCFSDMDVEVRVSATPCAGGLDCTEGSQ